MNDTSSTSGNEQREHYYRESPVQDSISLPPHTEPLTHQIGGHIHGANKEGKAILGLLKHENGDILKPLRPGIKKDVRELSFYENLYNGNCQDPKIMELKNFVPTFKGTWIGHVNGEDIVYMCLGDLTKRFIKPCSMDVKIGAQTYDPEASTDKIRCENKKYPAGHILGFRIVGMKFFSEPAQKYFVIDRTFGRKQTPESILDGLHLYFNKGYQCFVWAVLAAFLHRLKTIDEWFCTQRKLAFYSSSLLFIYEGDHNFWITWFQGIKHILPYQQHSIASDCVSDDSAVLSLKPVPSRTCSFAEHPNISHNSVPLAFCQLNSDDVGISCSVCGLQKDICSEIINNCALYDIRMIDFAHVFQSEAEDTNYISGLRNLTSYVSSLLQKIINTKH